MIIEPDQQIIAMGIASGQTPTSTPKHLLQRLIQGLIQRRDGSRVGAGEAQQDGQELLGPGDEARKFGLIFISDKHVQALLNYIGTKNITRELAHVLALSGHGSTIFTPPDQEKKTKAALTLGVNGHTIEFDRVDGREFMRLSAADANVYDCYDARALVCLAQSHGWKSITVHGREDQKEALWLEAHRIGLKVEGFEPKPDSVAARWWARDKAILEQRVRTAEIAPTAACLNVTFNKAQEYAKEQIPMQPTLTPNGRSRPRMN